MNSKQPLKQGEKILFGVFIAFIVAAVIGYVVLETIRLTSDKPMFQSSVSWDFTDEGNQGSRVFRKSRCTSCHRAMNIGTNMGLSLDGVGSKRDYDWLLTFLKNPGEVYTAQRLDHEIGREAAYVAKIPAEKLHLIATYLSQLKTARGGSSAPLPPEGRSPFIDSMVGMWAPDAWKEKYRDIRDKDPSESKDLSDAQSVDSSDDTVEK